jgi:hypothetical protein
MVDAVADGRCGAFIDVLSFSEYAIAKNCQHISLEKAGDPLKVRAVILKVRAVILKVRAVILKVRAVRAVILKMRAVILKVRAVILGAESIE